MNWVLTISFQLWIGFATGILLCDKTCKCGRGIASHSPIKKRSPLSFIHNPGKSDLNSKTLESWRKRLNWWRQVHTYLLQKLGGCVVQHKTKKVRCDVFPKYCLPHFSPLCSNDILVISLTIIQVRVQKEQAKVPEIGGVHFGWIVSGDVLNETLSNVTGPQRRWTWITPLVWS